MRKRILIVYHTLTGGTRQMAEAAGRGAQAAAHVTVLRAGQAGTAELLQADGYIFATPENLAAMSGQLKDFFDRTYYDGLDQLNGRPYLSLICAGSDGQNAATQIQRIATGWRLRAIAPAYIVNTHAGNLEQILAPKSLSIAELARCEELGATLAAGLELGVF